MLSLLNEYILSLHCHLPNLLTILIGKSFAVNLLLLFLKLTKVEKVLVIHSERDDTSYRNKYC